MHTDLAHPAAAQAGGQQFVQIGDKRYVEIPNSAAGPAPKYLVRNSDGKVYPYNDIIASDSANFTPTNVLPQSHVQEINAARKREIEEAAAIQQAQIHQEAVKKLAQLEYDKLLEQYMKDQQASTQLPTVEEQLTLDESVITSRDLAGLVAYAKEEFKVDVRGNLEAIRGQVRFLQGKRRETLKPKQEIAAVKAPADEVVAE
jgi:hypothetical protein